MEEDAAKYKKST